LSAADIFISTADKTSPDVIVRLNPENKIEQLVRRLIEKVTVYEDRFTVEFKSGMTVDVER